ncbi:GNAT family N-acetyltransferase [Neiella sp. HB171785]|uniref:GNAT family N-acetyltransferase n=1 Tax=Neiella litorisoli TaxID=2771431 RepID=A0A8J6UJ17_9GAMM|nr:GNAT family N-acetyltransferase [Neiella litorisoli]MBD1389718.1 GNAT family N-acetyltransferase [Neiella litorisoli]
MTTTTSLRLQYLGAEDAGIAASLLFQAYHDDAMFQRIFDADNENYEQRLRALFREELDVFWQYHLPVIGAFDSDLLVGVACLQTPDSPLAGGRFWNWRMKMLLSAGIVSTSRLLGKEQRICQALPSDNCYQLSLLATAPNYQGHGVGDTLLAGVESLLEEGGSADGVGIFVSQQRSIQWLENHRYQQIKQLEFANISGTLMFLHR